jgi:hypothetical protein
MHYGRWVVLIIFCGLFAFTAYYVYDKGFGRKWRALLAKEFHRYGLEISVRRLTLDPFRGLVAKDLEIYESDQRLTVLARISDVSLDINYGNLMQQESALNAVDLHDATLSIPLDPSHPGYGRAQITGLHSLIYFLPGRIEVRQASGDAYGIHLNASGTLVNPNAFKWALPFDSDREHRQEIPETFLGRLIREIQSLHFYGESPQLDLTFQVDLADPLSWRLQECHLRAEKFDRHAYPLRNLAADFSLENQRLDLRRFFVQDPHGELFCTGTWNVGTGEKQFQLRSSINLADLIGTDSRFPWNGKWKFDDPPEVELSGDWKSKEDARILGKLHFGQFSILNVPFQGLTAEFSREGDSWMISNGEVTQRSGTLSGDILNVPGDFRVRINSGLNPTELMPLFPARAQLVLAGWEFITSPVIQLTVRGKAPVPADLSGSGQVWLGKTKLHGSLMNSAAADFKILNDTIQYDQVRVTRDEGVGTGGFTYDFVNNQVIIRDANADLFPNALANWIHPTIGKMVQPFQFSLPPKIHADGTIQFKNGSTNDLRFEIQAANPFTYQYAGLQIVFNDGNGRFQVYPDRIDVEGFNGKIGAGTWSMQSRIALPLSQRESRSTISLRGIDTHDLAPHSGALRNYQGKVSGELVVRDSGTEGISATADLTLHDAVLSGARLFSPLLSQLSSSGFQEPLEVTTRFRFLPESVKFDTLQLQSGSKVVRLSGSLFFLGGLVQLSGDYEGIRIRGAGTLSKPNWMVEADKTENR